MEDYQLETIIANSIYIGCISTLKELGLWEEMISEKQAFKMYGERQIKEWRMRRTIVGYPSGNKTRAKYLYKRSELEIASRTLNINNVIQPSRMNQLFERFNDPRKI